MGRLVFAWIILLWLGGSLVAFAVKWPVGVAWFVIGGIYVGGDAWIEKHGDEHPRFSIAWLAAWRAIWGGAMIAVGIIYFRWDSIVLFVFGAWFLALAAFFTWALWSDRIHLSDGKPET